MSSVANALRPDTTLVSIMYANNETGNLLPIPEIGALLKDHPAVFHTDAVQAYGKMQIHPLEEDIDLLTTSGHKINGPKGVGFLYKRNTIKLPPYLHGGEQENQNWQKYLSFEQCVIDTLDAAGVTYQINGDWQHKLPHVLNLRFPGVSNDLLLMKLDLKGDAISTGSACTAGNVEPSHVLTAMYGAASPAIKESIRLSFGYGNTLEGVQSFANELATLVKKDQVAKD